MLELDRLTRRFGDLVALDALSFTVGRGQMFGFVGGNGAGKTTTMRLIMGVDEPDEGAVRWDGADPDRQVRRRFGYMPEERGLYPKMPAVRQLTYLARLHGVGKAEAGERARTWLTRFGLADRMDDPVEELSLGNQQRVQLAAALVHDPVLLVLDEPFSGLDPTGVDALSEVLTERAEAGVPVLFSSHQLELVERLCDAVAIIDRGRLVASGAVTALREQGRPPVLRVQIAAPDGATDGATPGVTPSLATDGRSWAERIPGVTVLSHDDGDHHLLLADGVDDQQVLAAAQAAGRVVHFGPVRPTLAELYREAVQEHAEALA